MTHRTAELGDFESLLASEFPPTSPALVEAREAEIQERQVRLASFPHAVLLQVSFAEMDYANRWCWQQFGPASGECMQKESEYPACSLLHRHSHEGKWISHWYFKTEYNYGYNEWCFALPEDRDRFVEFVPQINWGENFPK
jgi:hypothetical protein